MGKRLAIAAVNTIPTYRDAVVKATGSTIEGMTATQGPTLSGCDLTSKTELTLHFNQSLLGTEGLMLRSNGNSNSNMSAWAHEMSSSHKQLNKTDSEVLMVCSIPPTDPENPDADLGNATTCQCQTWAYLHLPQAQAEAEVGKPVKSNAVLYCHDGPGWKPPQSMRKAAVKGRDPKGYPYAGQWAAVPLKQQSDAQAQSDGVVSAVADLSKLEGRFPYAVRLGWPLGGTAGVQVGKSDDMCCTSQETADGLAVCVPGNCPLYSSESGLPANPFFATITPQGKCRCHAPQACDA